MADKHNISQYLDKGFLKNLFLRGSLILRLMGDKRVNFLLKLLPIGALIYLVSPVDLLPGVALPIIGVLDDAVVVWLGASLFVNLCPEGVVQEHMLALQGGFSAGADTQQAEAEEVIDVEAHDA